LHYIITTASGGTADAWTLVLDFIIMGIGASGLLMAVQTKSRQVFVLGILLFIIGVVVSYLLAMG
jgi:CHASE2 domain-containing sensor protein